MVIEFSLQVSAFQGKLILGISFTTEAQRTQRYTEAPLSTSEFSVPLW